MTERRKILLVCGGGDWYDASADMLAVPEGRDLDADVEEYPGYRACKKFLREWLMSVHGYDEPSDDEAVEVWDD